jgi:hypothetical protein
MVMLWYEIGLSGKTPDVPSKNYKWNQLPELNNYIYEKYKNDTWEVVQKRFISTEAKIMSLINSIDERIMLKPSLHPWMNKNNLIAYFGSCTSSHYQWASTLIKKFIKNN